MVCRRFAVALSYIAWRSGASRTLADCQCFDESGPKKSPRSSESVIIGTLSVLVNISTNPSPALGQNTVARRSAARADELAHLPAGVQPRRARPRLRARQRHTARAGTARLNGSSHLTGPVGAARLVRPTGRVVPTKGSPLPLLPGQPLPLRRRPLRFITSIKHQIIPARCASRVDLAGFS